MYSTNHGYRRIGLDDLEKAALSQVLAVPEIYRLGHVASSREPRRIVVGLVEDVVGRLVERRLGVIRHDQPLETTCESYVVGGPVLLRQFGDIAIVHFSVGVRYAETVAVTNGAAERCRSEPAQPDGRVRSLDRRRGDLDLVEVEVRALHGDGLSIEKTADDPQRLVGTRPALVEGYAEAFEFLELVASADSDLETAARNDVDYRDILGEAYGVVERHQEHSRRDADPLGASGDRSSGGQK